MARCTLCKANILWARTEGKNGKKGSSMPLDLPPNPNGNCWVVDGTVFVMSAAKQPPDGARRYTPHFAHCEPYIGQKRVEAAIKKAAKA